MSRTVIVTGGAGFVGSHIIRRLLLKNYEVHLVTRRGGSLWRIDDIKDKITIHYGLLEDLTQLASFLKKNRSFGILHLATYGTYPLQNEVKTILDVNIIGVMNLLEAYEKSPCPRLVVAGSSSEYGKKEGPMHENDILEPNNLYGAAKAAQTLLCQAFAKSSSKSIVILRLFSVYGAYEQERRLVRSVIESALQKKPIQLASGKEARDFIYASDVADAFIHVLEYDTAFHGDIFNIGTGIQTTIENLAKTIKSLVGVDVPIQLNAYKGRAWDSTTWVADITKTKNTLSWHANTNLHDGVRQTIEWYKRYAGQSHRTT